MKDLSSLLLCFSVTIMVTFSLTAQTDLWTHHSQMPSYIVGITLLDNGHPLKVSQSRHTTELTEINPNNGSVDTSVVSNPASDMVYFEQLSGDSLLLVSEWGNLWLLDRGTDTLARVTQLFPQIATLGNYHQVSRVERVGATLIAYTFNSGDDHHWSSRYVYGQDTSFILETDLGPGMVSQWHSDEGYQATISRAPADLNYTVTVNSPAGETLNTVYFPSSVKTLSLAVFKHQNRLYLYGGETLNGSVKPTLFDLDVASGNFQRKKFAGAGYPGGINFRNLRIIAEELILVGRVGSGWVSEPFAIALNESNEELWRFSPIMRPEVSYFSDVIATSIKPGDLYFCGDTDLTDVGPGGNAFIMSVAFTVTSTDAARTGLLRSYPNPTSNVLHLNGLEQVPESVSVFDQSGRLVGQASGTHTVEVAHLPAGVYFLGAEVDGLVYTGRFVKK